MILSVRRSLGYGREGGPVVVVEGRAEGAAELVAARLRDVFTTPPANRPYSAETAAVVVVVSWSASSMKRLCGVDAEVVLDDDAVDHEQVLEGGRARDGHGAGGAGARDPRGQEGGLLHGPRHGQLLDELRLVAGGHLGGLVELARGLRHHGDALASPSGAPSWRSAGWTRCRSRRTVSLHRGEAGELEGDGVVARRQEREDVVAVHRRGRRARALQGRGLGPSPSRRGPRGPAGRRPCRRGCRSGWSGRRPGVPLRASAAASTNNLLNMFLLMPR